MKKQLWLTAAVLTAFVLLFAACDDGDGPGPGDNTDQWPEFSNAQKLNVDQFPSKNNPELTTTQWKFYHPGGEEDEDFGAPHNPKTFKNSTYLLIASVGGGKAINSDNNPRTEFNANGFDAIKFKVDAANDSWASDYISMTFQPQVNTEWLIPFQHDAVEIVYFVYDLSVYIPNLGDINNTNSEIVFKIDWEPAEKALGKYQAYITSANLTQGSGYEMKNDSADSTIDHNTPLGWITKNPGLILTP